MCQKQILTHESKLIIIVSKTKVAREAYDNYIIEKCIAANCATGTGKRTASGGKIAIPAGEKNMTKHG